MKRLFLIFALTMLIMPLASAEMTWDNVKRYDPAQQAVTITNALGLGSDIAKVTLDTPLNNYVMPGKDRLVAQFTIDNYGDYNSFLEQMKFYDLNNRNHEIDRTFTLKYAEIIEKERPTYEQKCSDKELENKTIVKECAFIENGIEKYPATIWHDFNEKALLPRGKITLGIFTEVYNNDKVEWIPNMFGVTINEWATWTSGLNVGLQAYWNMSNSSSTIVDQVSGRFNFTMYGTCANDGKVGLGLSQSASCFANISLNPMQLNIGNDTNTIAFWYKRIGAVDSNNYYIVDFGNAASSGAGDKGNTFVQHSSTMNAGKVAGWATFYDVNNIQLSLEDSANDANWHYYVQVRNSTGGVWMWKDGVRQATGLSYLTYNMSVPSSNPYINIFKRGATYVNGAIDELAVWNRSLSETEITQLYNGGSGMTYIPYSAPTLTAILPANVTYFANNISINYSVSVSPLATLDSCWYSVNNGANVSLPTGCLNSTMNLSNGNYAFRLYANDSTSTISYATPVYFSVFTDYWENSRTFNTTTYETTTEMFYLNFSYNPILYSFSTAYLNYNGTNYTATTTAGGSGNVVYNASAVAKPAVGGNPTNYSFYWMVTLTNSSGSSTLSTLYKSNQTSLKAVAVNITSNAACPTGLSPTYYFNFAEEANRTSLSTVDVSYNLQYGISNSTGINAYANLTAISNLTICINSSVSTYTIGYGEVQYQAESGFTSRKYYLFSNTRLTNSTVNTTLYDIANGQATSFLLTVQDNNYVPYVGYYVALLRWYPELNQYVNVEMGKTDNKGQTIVRVKTEDVDYRIAIYKADGTLVQLLDPIRMACLTSPCSYNVFVQTNTADYVSLYGVQQSLTYNSTTNKITFIWNDPAQITSAMNLTVWRSTVLNPVVICSVSANGFTGVLQCDTTGETGTLTANVYRTASPPKFMESIIVDLGSGLNAIGGGVMGLLFGAILIMMLGLVGVFSPVAAIVLGVVALIPLWIFGAVNYMIIVGIGIMGGVIWHVLKRT